MENSKNPRHTNQDDDDDGLDSNLVEVIVHNLSQGGTVLEQLDHSDENNQPHDMGTVELINTVASRHSL